MESTSEQLKKIWAKIPEIECKKDCNALCKINHVFALDVDNRSMKENLGNQFVSLPNIYETMGNGVEHKFHKKDSCCDCPYLKDGLCSVYDTRPTICRIYGAMGECPYGCQPKEGFKFLTKEELFEIVSELKKIDPTDSAVQFFEEDIFSYFDDYKNNSNEYFGQPQVYASDQ